MSSYKYKVVHSNNFKKSLKKLIKRGKNIDKLLDVVDRLANKEMLESKYKVHKLIDDKNYKNCFECHIEPDWLLVYKYNEENLILLLFNSGTHSELFKN